MEEKLKELPQSPGVYLFRNKKKQVIYVGKSVHLRSRVRSYFQKNTLDIKILRMVKHISSVDHVVTNTELEALILEAYLIKSYKPFFNSMLKDDKRYLYIKITTNEEYPRILTSRKEDDPACVYFGPYPSSRAVVDVLKIIRKVFPYCTQGGSEKRRCFYAHLLLCNPCPADIQKLTREEKDKQKRKYRRNIKNIIDILSGKGKKVKKRLEILMKYYAVKEEYEQAGEAKRQLFQLNYISKYQSQGIRKYLDSVDQDDNKLSAGEDLIQILKPFYPLTEISRIEGYDISNTQGKNPTGSMVVFENSEPSKKNYRRFKITGGNTPDDPKMMSEMLERRLRHVEWTYPDVLMVDGGKPQVGAAFTLLNKLNIKIPVVGLAKRFEKLVIMDKGKLKELEIPLTSSALQLLQRLRDEAHRFANTYHKKLRAKSYIIEK